MSEAGGWYERKYSPDSGRQIPTPPPHIVERPLPKTRDLFLETVPTTEASTSGYSKISRQHLTGYLVNREPQKNRNKPMRGWHRW
jgi:hypothetical protein